MRRKMKKIGVLAAAIFLALGNYSLVNAFQYNLEGYMEAGLPTKYIAKEIIQTGDGIGVSVSGTSFSLWAKTDTVGNNNNNLMTGSNLKSEVRVTSDGAYVQASNTTKANLLALDTGIKESKLYKIQKQENSITVTGETDENGKTTYTFSVKDADVTSAVNTGLVKSSDAYAELRDGAEGTYVHADATTATNLTELDKQVNKNDTEISKLQNLDGLTERGESQIKDYAQQSILVETGAGIVATPATETKTIGGVTYTTKKTYTLTADTAGVSDGKATLVSGGEAYTELRAEGAYVHANATTATNLTALDTQLRTNTEDIADLKNLTNLTEDGKKEIKNLAQGYVKMKGDNISLRVDEEKDDATGNLTYRVTAVDALVEPENTGILTADNAYTEFRTEGNYIHANQTVGTNLGVLDAQIKTNADGIIDLENRIGNKLDVIAGQINPVAAGAAAMAALQPEAYHPENRWSFAVGYGHYKNENATAMGVFFKPEAMATFSAGGTVWSGDPMLSVGASFKAGRADREAKKREVKNPAERVKALETATQKQEAAMEAPIARLAKWETEEALQAKRLAALEMEHQALQAKRAAQMRTGRAQEKELAALCAMQEKGKAKRANLKEQMVQILARIEMVRGEGL